MVAALFTAAFNPVPAVKLRSVEPAEAEADRKRSRAETESRVPSRITQPETVSTSGAHQSTFARSILAGDSTMSSNSAAPFSSASNATPPSA